jgi:hypothetical protein
MKIQIASTVAALWLLCLVSPGAAEPLPGIRQIPREWSFLREANRSHAFSNRLLAKAEKDECFDGVGVPYPPIEGGQCNQGMPKVNQAYVWGLTEAGEKSDKLWFGTAPNVHCLVISGFLGNLEPQTTQSWVCEYGASQYANDPNLIPGVTPVDEGVGDWRPSQAFVYDLKERKLEEKTPATNDPNDPDGLWNKTLGIRSAGSLGDLVFLAGPALRTLDGVPFNGVNFFAFDAADGKLIASCRVPGWTNIRQWRVIDGVLYAGIGKPNSAGGGGIIRFNGTLDVPLDSSSPTCGFEEVAQNLGDVAYLTEAEGRIAASTWGGAPQSTGFSTGVLLSSPISGGLGSGLDTDDTWTQVMRYSNYEPDLALRNAYAGGAIAYWKGALYTGSMHVPGIGYRVHAELCGAASATCYGPPADEQEALELLLNSNRTISIWRIKDLNEPTPTVELLYGETELPKLTAVKTFTPTSTGWTPKFGPSGFGNVFNNYTWTATVIRGSLLFGTMDWRYLIDASVAAAIGTPIRVTSGRGYGADLWRFVNPEKPARPEDTGGAGNYLNYGIRTMLTSSDGMAVYIGTANPMNLEEGGGWELRRLVPIRPNNRQGQKGRDDEDDQNN